MLHGNNLLESLESDDRATLEPFVSEIVYNTNQLLHEPGDHVGGWLFPRFGAVASYFVILEDGEPVETVMIGREGALGSIAGDEPLPAFNRSRVIHGGSFYRISGSDLMAACQQNLQVQALFSRYADCLMAQVFQSIACNAAHSIEQRAAKWMCAAVDRTSRLGIEITQEQLAAVIGSGRSYASRVVQRFKRENLVQTRRGGLEVLDYEGLHRRACRCNDRVRGRFDTVLSGVYPNEVPA